VATVLRKERLRLLLKVGMRLAEKEKAARKKDSLYPGIYIICHT
jgi:hypothetical protein